MLKKIIVGVICLCMLIACVGCGDNSNSSSTDPTQTDNSTPETTITDNTTPSNDSTETPVIDHSTITVKQNETALWEKPYTAITIEDIVITKEWDQSINVNGVTISSLECVDLSVLNNHFFDTEHHAILNEVYQARTLKTKIKGPNVDLGNYVDAQLIVSASTFVDGDKYYGVIDEIHMSANINIYEADKTKLINPENQVCIGSNMKHALSVLGNPIDQSMGVNGIGGATVLLIYQSDNVKLTLTLTADIADDLDNAVITAIKWEPLFAQSVIYTQDFWQ